MPEWYLGKEPAVHFESAVVLSKPPSVVQINVWTSEVSLEVIFPRQVDGLLGRFNSPTIRMGRTAHGPQSSAYSEMENRSMCASRAP